MALDLVGYESLAQQAVRSFWESRDAARQKQNNSGKSDQGERASVTSGKNMNGFLNLVLAIVERNGLADAQIHQQRATLTLPGYFRPTKLWDLLVMHKGQLVAAIELKSQVGPSFGNNFNNRTEEAIGTAHDFWTAYRYGAFGKQPHPFVGWLMLVEEAKGSTCPVKGKSNLFAQFKEFDGSSYLQRYDPLCQKLVQEQLYTAASVISSPKDALTSGRYSELSSLSCLKTFVTSLASHIAGHAARLND